MTIRRAARDDIRPVVERSRDVVGHAIAPEMIVPRVKRHASNRTGERKAEVSDYLSETVPRPPLLTEPKRSLPLLSVA